MDIGKIVESLNRKGYAVESGTSGLSQEEISAIRKFRPENAFIAYGTLGPGRPNHYKIEHIPGKWEKATINGKLEAKGWGADLGYYGYVKTNTPENKDIEAFILFADELKKHWRFLDDFEGDEYKRILAEFKLENGMIGMGNIYTLK